MKRTLNYISFLLLGSSLAFFAATSGCAARVGIYDSDHRDYHRWDAGEDRAYHAYWQENHGREPYRDFKKLNADQQKDYWNWRHSHPS